jgi:cell cycle protein kinase DBF2
MASQIPVAVGRGESMLPMPPPVAHQRFQSDYQGRPHTPPQGAYISPVHTPQGSPSKKNAPPGSSNLPNIFENALKLSANVDNGGKLTPTLFQSHHQQTSPGYGDASTLLDDSGMDIDSSVIHKDSDVFGSPRKSNKENTPPASRLGKEYGQNVQYNQAQISRQGIYQTRENLTPTGGRKGYETQRGLTAEELEKLQQPKVKRLANVTQLCK